MRHRRRLGSPALVAAQAERPLLAVPDALAAARSGPVLMFACDRTGILTFLDGGLLAELCDLPGSLIGRSLFTVLKEYPEVGKLGARLLDGERLEFASVAHGPYQLEVWGIPVRTPSGEPDGATGIIVDISSRVAAEQAVLDAARREMALIEHASDVILVIDPDGLVRSANPAAHRLLKRAAWSDGETLRFESLVHPEDHDRVRRYFAGAVEQEGSTAPIEYRIGHADGSWRTVESIAANMVHDPAVTDSS